MGGTFKIASIFIVISKELAEFFALRNDTIAVFGSLACVILALHHRWSCITAEELLKELLHLLLNESTSQSREIKLFLQSDSFTTFQRFPRGPTIPLKLYSDVFLSDGALT
jgi:hypothetical protein